MPKEMGMPREMRMTNGTAARRNGRAANSVPGTQLSPPRPSGSLAIPQN